MKRIELEVDIEHIKKMIKLIKESGYSAILAEYDSETCQYIDKTELNFVENNTKDKLALYGRTVYMTITLDMIMKQFTLGEINEAITRHVYRNLGRKKIAIG